MAESSLGRAVSAILTPQGRTISPQSYVAQQPHGNLNNFFGDVLLKLIALSTSGNFNDTPLFHDSLTIPTGI